MKKPVVRLALIAGLGSLFALVCGAAHAEVVTIYTSANFAPLVLGDGRGLYPDLVDHLNRQKIGSITFRLAYLPRKRLQVKMEDGTLDGIVIGMMPAWLNDTARTRYLWSAAFSSDRYVLASQQARPCLPGKLHKRTVGMTAGYVYQGLDKWIASSHLMRSDGVSDERNLEKLLLGRIDCVIVAESMARYYLRARGLAGKVHLETMPGQPSERHFAALPAQRAVFEQIAPVIKRLRDDPQWQRQTARYD